MYLTNIRTYVYAHINIHSSVAYSSHKSVLSCIVICMNYRMYIYICPTARTCVHQTAACVYALHYKQLPVGGHKAHSRPIQLFIFIVGQSRKSHHVMVSLTKHVASTLHWGDRHVCIPQKGIEPQQVHERECNTDNYVHMVIANDNKTILMASHI